MKVILILCVFAVPFLSADDKIYKRKITDTSKKLEIRKGDITDTKALLRKTEHANPEQVRMMKQILAAELGGAKNYTIASRKSPASIKTSMKSLWKIYLIDQDLKEANKWLKKKGLTKGLKKYYGEKKEKLNSDKSAYNTLLNKNLAFMKKIVESEAIAGKGKFFENEVSKDGVGLIDKFGEVQATLKKGDKVQTKVHPKDGSFYLVKHDGQELFAKRIFFKLK